MPKTSRSETRAFVSEVLAEVASSTSTVIATPPLVRPFKGEATCCKCEKVAYYWQSNKPCCGRHSDKEIRVNLKALPAHLADKKAAEKDKELAQLAKASPGFMIGMTQMRMMKDNTVPNCVMVFPNRKARHTDTTSLKGMYHYGCPSLSPMCLGPVLHGDPSIKNPLVTCVENEHQGFKVFWSELEPDGITPLPIYFERRKKIFADPIPRRHKLGDSKEEHMAAAGLPPGVSAKDHKNANHCAFSLRWDPITQKEKRFSYVESRVFYCQHYEELARREPEYEYLIRLAPTRTLMIMGYDARDIPVFDLQDKSKDELKTLFKTWYLDPTTPFGHETVLLVMLVCQLRGLIPPWRTA